MCIMTFQLNMGVGRVDLVHKWVYLKFVNFEIIFFFCEEYRGSKARHQDKIMYV